MFLETICNMTINCNNFTQPYHNETFRMVLGFGLGISSLMSILENAIVCVVLLKYRILRTPSNAILLSLAFANFCVGFLVAPLYSLEWLNLIPHPHSEIVITARESLIRVFFGISTLTMAFISYDRYLHIRNLKNYKMNRRLLYGGLTLCWLAPIAISSLYLPNVHFKKSMIYVEVISTAFSVLTLAAIIVPYGGVLLVLRRQTSAASSGHITKMLSTENQRKASRTVAIIVTVYLVMNGPAIINEVLLYSYHLDMVCAFLVMANSSVNPIIYFYQTPSLKKHAMMLKKRILVALHLIDGKNKGSTVGSRGSREHEPSEVMVIIDSQLSSRNSRYEYEKKLCSVWTHLLDKSKNIDGSTLMVGMKYPYCFDEPSKNATFV